MKRFSLPAGANLNTGGSVPTVIVSLDIHDGNKYMYGVARDTGEVVVDANIIGDYQPVLRRLKGLGTKDNILILLEAGNQGYAPYRLFAKHGYSCLIIAPSSIPKRGKQQKTDRLNAIDNLDYHLSGLLSYVTVPDAEDEDTRECLRYRYEKVWEIIKIKQQIVGLLKRHGRVFEGTKSNWTRPYYRWLKKVSLPSFTRLRLDCMLEDLHIMEGRLQDLDVRLDRIFADNERYRNLMYLYALLPGIGRVGAMTLVLEGGDLRRFRHPGGLMNYVGLIPGKHASGTKDPALKITKAGNRYLRIALVGAAKFYRDRRLLKSGEVIREMPKALGSFLQRCQDRLHGRYRYLCNKGKPANKAKCAVARELCGFVWELAVKNGSWATKAAA